MPPHLTNETADAVVAEVLRDLAPALATVGSPEQRRLALAHVLTARPPEPISPTTTARLDELLSWENSQRPRTAAASLPRVGAQPPLMNISLWQGDITTLEIDAIVNAANDQMLGCFVPGHACIDNAIHAVAGPGLRAECAEHMQEQGHPEDTGTATITGAHHLPARHVLHTVGPIVPSHRPTPAHAEALAASYRSCLDLAASHGLRSIAFCCISTGVFGYPIAEATDVAIASVTGWLQTRAEEMHVVFNTFSDRDTAVYRLALGAM